MHNYNFELLNLKTKFTGTPEHVGITEHAMEHIAKVTGNNPMDVRLRNMSEEHKKFLVPMIENLKKTANYDSRIREILLFNKVNEVFNTHTLKTLSLTICVIFSKI